MSEERAPEQLYSDDGLYWWDGEEWQLAGSAPPRGWKRRSLWPMMVPFAAAVALAGLVSSTCTLPAD
jgi:hypothetical protein